MKGAKLTRVGDSLYRLTGPAGRTISFGVVGKAFVLANDTKHIGSLAGQSPAAVPGAKGAVVLSADAEKLAGQIVQRFSGGNLSGALGASLFTGPLGRLRGSVTSDTSGMRGSFKLGID